MAGANSNIQITDLDFDTIKNNLKNFLKSQDTLKDYNYEGSALSTLIDLLAYNTQYNAYYTNMVANEMFLDTAIHRDSVVSHAKTLGYTPKSVRAPYATVNVKVNNVNINDSQLTLPKYTQFISESVDGVNYTFTADDTYTTTTNFGDFTATFQNVILKQGIPASVQLTVLNSVNPTSKITIPEENVDTSTLQVLVYQSSTSTSYEIYNLADNFLSLDGNSTVYFLQEGVGGKYEIYFGDGIIGKKLTDGNVITLNYLTSAGADSVGANNFSAMDTVQGYSDIQVEPVAAAMNGVSKESIESIKFHAPKQFSAQKRAVSKQDYITAIQNNNLGFAFDAVNVWGGEENNPPVYGQVMVAIKPSGSYTLTQVQKEKLISEVIRPISVLTVVPTFVDPDYTYIQITANVLYDQKKTNLTAAQLQSAIKTSIANFASTSLNTFNSTFAINEFNDVIKNTNQSIITNEISIKIQKKFLPNLSAPTTYKLQYGTPLQKGLFQSGIYTTPALSFRNPLNFSQTIDGVHVEEVPSSSGGVESISVLNPGFGYISAPTVTIKGDGTGAEAYALISDSGYIKDIIVSNPGSNYTSAIAIITPSSGDSSGQAGAALVNLEGRFGTLRAFYNNTENVKTIFNDNVGTVDYQTGVVTLNSFSPLSVDDPLGQLTVTGTPTTSIISSSYNRIITVDPFDSNAIIVNVTAKT